MWYFPLIALQVYHDRKDNQHQKFIESSDLGWFRDHITLNMPAQKLTMVHNANSVRSQNTDKFQEAPQIQILAGF